MPVIFKISLRNLWRQKRRNILLGIGIAFGMCILIVANAFSHGLSDILLNKIIKWMTGHILVTVREKDVKEWELIRDQARFQQIIQERIAGEKDIYEGVATETSIGGHSHSVRALGNGRAEMIVVVGIELEETFYQEVETLSGNIEEMMNPNLENPILLYDTMAEKLNVQLHDTIHVRFTTVYGQIQSARFTIVAILKSTNPFMSFAAFTSLPTLKPLMGLKPYETGSFSVVMKNLEEPKYVLEQANRLHEALQPNAAGYTGVAAARGVEQTAQVLAVPAEPAVQKEFAALLRIKAGSLEATLADAQAALLSQPLADKLGVRVGDQITSTYTTKFEGEFPPRDYRVGAIFEPTEVVTGDMLFLHAEQFYATCFPSPPKYPAEVARQSPLFPLLLKEWMLLERSPDQKAWEKKYRALEDKKWRGRIVDVQTMYELASDVLQLEQVLDVVTLVAVFVLFFIILIGVVNTLRMTIRERTREIGTVRAIGMQRGDVRWSFVTEVLLLAFFASLAGVIFAFIAMALLRLPKFESESMFTMFLLNKHLHFVPTLFDLVKNLVIILTITFVTAFFPAHRAAKLSVAEALRHYE